MMFKIQIQSSYRQPVCEDFNGFINPSILPSDRVPSLTELFDMFTTGRPLDASLERHLEYNDLENNPVLKKGFDLVDYSQVAKANKKTLDEVQDEIQKAKLVNKNVTPTPESAPPELVSTT